MDRLQQKVLQIWLCKKPFCKHEHGCISSAILQTLKTIKYGLIISSIFQFIKSGKALLKGKQNFYNSFNKQTFTIVLFLSASTLTLRLIKCGMRWLRNKDDGFGSFLAGVGAGIVGVKTLDKGYWYILIMFMASRIVSAIHRILIEKKVLNQQKMNWHFYTLFTFAHIVHSYGYFIEPDILKPDMYNLYEKMSVLTPSEKKWHLSSLQHTYRKLKDENRNFYSDFLLKKIEKLRAQV